MSSSAAGPAPAPAGAELFRHHHTAGFADLLERLGVSLLVSTYQAGKLVVIRAARGKVSTLLRSFEQPMGLAVDGRRLVVGTRAQVWTLRNAPDVAAQLDPPGAHDACYVPRSSHVTGDVRIHEIAWAGDELWLVNTRFSCLCTLHPDHSFVPRWRPPFVSALAAEDRCHLNGLAVVDGQPAFVTALGATDTPDGWRANKAAGGVVVDVASGEVVVGGLSMPHSPRHYQGRLWLLNSGRGQLITLDSQRGTTQTVAELPGYTRGLAFHSHFAFVGLSKIRETATFGGLPIAERQHELECGIYAVDIRSGEVAGFMRFEAGCEELFDVQVLPGVRYPAVIGFQKDTLNGIYIVPRS